MNDPELCMWLKVYVFLPERLLSPCIKQLTHRDTWQRTGGTGGMARAKLHMPAAGQDQLKVCDAMRRVAGKLGVPVGWAQGC